MKIGGIMMGADCKEEEFMIEGRLESMADDYNKSHHVLICKYHKTCNYIQLIYAKLSKNI